MATSKKKTTKKASGAASANRRPDTGSMIPYGPPIRDAIARGDVQEMRKLATSTRKWLKDVQTALGSLDKAIAKKGSK
jgi:Domain of unknown function (DUF1843)